LLEPLRFEGRRRNMRRIIVVCAIIAFAFIGTPVWASLCVLDQFQENQNFGYAVGGSTMMAQTFTADLTGVLCHIEIGNTTGGVVWYSTSPPVVEIRDTTVVEGQIQPGSNILGSVTLSTLVPSDGWTPSISFLTQGIDITEGQTYSIVLWAKDQSGAVAVGATADTIYSVGPYYGDYLGGDLWTYGYDEDLGAYTWLRDTHIYDMQFRTYVQAIPLPAGVWLGICAVSIAGWHLKRQRG
jgi:hypothetical protein